MKNKTLTAAETLIALGNGEKITSDLMNGAYIFLDKNRIIDSFGHEINCLYLDRLFMDNIYIYKEPIIKYKYAYQVMGGNVYVSDIITEEEADEMFKLIPCQRLDFTKIVV